MRKLGQLFVDCIVEFFEVEKFFLLLLVLLEFIRGVCKSLTSTLNANYRVTTLKFELCINHNLESWPIKFQVNYFGGFWEKSFWILKNVEIFFTSARANHQTNRTEICTLIEPKMPNICVSVLYSYNLDYSIWSLLYWFFPPSKTRFF